MCEIEIQLMHSLSALRASAIKPFSYFCHSCFPKLRQ